jgi:hypothetical protein
VAALKEFMEVLWAASVVERIGLVMFICGGLITIAGFLMMHAREIWR